MWLLDEVPRIAASLGHVGASLRTQPTADDGTERENEPGHNVTQLLMVA